MFLHRAGVAAALLPQALSPAALDASMRSLADRTHDTPAQAAEDEAYWAQVRAAYRASPTLVNLNNGGVSPQPDKVQAQVELHHRWANEAPGYYMWRVMGRQREAVRHQLAAFVGCESEELALLRNTTEALETVIFGLDLVPGDEVLTTSQDYPSLLDALAKRARREGIVVRQIDLPVPCEDDGEILRRFEAAITPRTRALLCCHVNHLAGQVLPVQAICDLARQHGMQSIIDGAHAVAQLDFRIDALGCDYYGASLHKWLSAPFGTGMLYVRRARIAGLWPLYGYPEAEHEQISKFEHLGTRSIPLELGIAAALDFHEAIGTARKGARLRYLKQYWVSQVRDLPTFRLLSSMDARYGSALTTFALAGWPPAELSAALTQRFHLYVTAFDHAAVQGVRITPQVYTSPSELDELVRAIRTLAAERS
ncbi:MAG: aminotransferase class V-fold PLP-dependent enzyme [Bacteroidia bacterium]